MKPLVEHFGRGLGHSRQVERKLRLYKLAARLFAPDQFQIIRREHPGEREKPRLWPFLVQKMAVATGAFHARTHENLRHIRGALDRVHVTLISDVSGEDPLAVGFADERLSV